MNYEYLDSDGAPVTEYELERRFDDLLDDDGPAVIAGLEYSVSRALKTVDPIAYRECFLDYVNALIEDGELTETTSGLEA